MAAPPKVSMEKLSGVYVMNSTLSDPVDPILSLQGLSWFLRKAISLATITLSVHQYRGPAEGGEAEPQSTEPTPTPPSQSSEDPIHIDITQTATGGISTTQEDRTMDWLPRPHSDRIFGNVTGRNRMFTEDPAPNPTHFQPAGPSDPSDHAFLRAHTLRDLQTPSSWDEDGGDHGRGLHVHSWAISDEVGWTAEQTWGFERIGAAAESTAAADEAPRYYSRRVVVRKTDGSQVERARLVYDYKGEVRD